jgi:hypothetical protein
MSILLRPLRSLAPAFYLVAALLLLFPAVDFISDAWPFRPDAVGWRYGVAGGISTYVLLPILGLLLASITAAWLNQHVVSRWLSLIGWIGAVLLLLALGGFLLDSLQAPPEAKWVTTKSFVIAAAKIAVAALTYVILGVCNLRAARLFEPGVGPRKVPPLPPIVGHL